MIQRGCGCKKCHSVSSCLLHRSRVVVRKQEGSNSSGISSLLQALDNRGKGWCISLLPLSQKDNMSTPNEDGPHNFRVKMIEALGPKISIRRNEETRTRTCQIEVMKLSRSSRGETLQLEIFSWGEARKCKLYWKSHVWHLRRNK